MKITYAVGDIHGRIDLFRAARSLIKQDAKKHGYENPTVVYLGDYVDRGPESALVLYDLIERKMEGFEEVALRGNHEDIMLDAIGWGNSLKVEAPYWRRMWLKQGGVETLKSYGCMWHSRAWGTLAEDVAYDTGSWDWEDVATKIDMKHINFMRMLPYSYDDGERFFVHAGVRPDAPVDDLTHQGPEVYSWLREKLYKGSYTALDGRTRLVVHGHTPIRDGKAFVSEHRVNLDNGALYCNKQAIGVFGEPDGTRIIYTPHSIPRG